MTSEQRAEAVYDAMMGNCPDCHHPWAWHVHGHGGGCLRHALLTSACLCQNARPADILLSIDEIDWIDDLIAEEGPARLVGVNGK